MVLKRPLTSKSLTSLRQDKHADKHCTTREVRAKLCKHRGYRENTNYKLVDMPRDGDQITKGISAKC